MVSLYVKGKENGHVQAYAPNGAMVLKRRGGLTSKLDGYPVTSEPHLWWQAGPWRKSLSRKIALTRIKFYGRKLQVKAFPAFGQMQGCADFMRLWRNFMPRQLSSWTVSMIFHYHLRIGEVRTIRNETTYPIHGKYPLNPFFCGFLLNFLSVQSKGFPNRGRRLSLQTLSPHPASSAVGGVVEALGGVGEQGVRIPLAA